MSTGLSVAATGMTAQQINIDTIANDLANVNTPGYKMGTAEFKDLFYQIIKPAGQTTASGGQIPVGIALGMGTELACIRKDFSQGDYRNTGNELDWAIEGQGFFKVTHNEEEIYVRSGNFKLDSEGYVCTAEGDRLQPEVNVSSNTTSITIDSSGHLVGFGPGNIEAVSADIKLYKFPNPAGLQPMGGNLYRTTPASGEASEGAPGIDGFGSISQGFLEMSNVDVVNKMVEMIVAQRTYESCSKVIKTEDAMLQVASNLR
ncbi:MAG: flagellar basal-body rod protein FlgG [Pseudomonadota bacterium]